MNSHPDDAAIEAFALNAGGVGDDDAGAAFVEHVSACDVCSAKLAREAQLELALIEVHDHRRAAPAAAPVPLFGGGRARPRPRVAFVAKAFVLAAAAAVALYAGRRPILAMRDGAGTSAAAGAMAVASCAAGANQLECIAEAHRSGRYLEFPRGTGIATLGTAPGLSVLVDFDLPTERIDGYEAAVAPLRAKIEACIAQNTSAQSAPILTGEYGIRVEIDSRGEIVSARTLIMVLDGKHPDDASVATAGCFERVWQGVRFAGNGHTTRSETEVKFVWRE